MKPAEINLKWSALQQRVAEEFDNEKPDIKVMLFLIGVQELGKGPKKFSKRQKEELMHIATCKLFSHAWFLRTGRLGPGRLAALETGENHPQLYLAGTGNDHQIVNN